MLKKCLKMAYFTTFGPGFEVVVGLKNCFKIAFVTPLITVG